MNLIKKIIAAALVLCIALSLVGCGDTTWIAEVDGVTVPSGLYIYYQTEAYGDALYNLYQTNSDNSNYLMAYIYYYNYGYVDPALFTASMSDGTTVEEYINTYALDMCKQYVVVDRLFNELGLEITADEQALIDNQVRNTWNSNGDSWEKIGVSEDSLKIAVVSKIKEERVFDAYYEIGGLNGTTEEEIEAYFSDNYARIKYMTFTFAESMDDAVDSARKDEQFALANSYLDRANAGEDMNTLIAEHKAELAAENETDADDADDEVSVDDVEVDLYANESILSKEATYPTEKFVNYVFNNCNIGEYTVIQDDLCFYLVQRLDILEREGLYDNYRDSILTELFDKDYTTLMNQRLAGYTVTENTKSIKRYTVEKAFPENAD